MLLKCYGGDGNAPSTAQIPPTTKISPGYLPYSWPYKIGCSQTLDEKVFFGDPGSVYLVYCD